MSDGAALERALGDDARRDHFALHIISSAPAAGGIDVKFTFAGNSSKPLDIIAVVADDTDRSNVLRGENGGRQLQHVSVARSMARVATVKNDGEQAVHVSLPEGIVAGSPGHHLILFAQESHQGAILGAATTAL